MIARRVHAASEWVRLNGRDLRSWDLYVGFVGFATTAALAAGSDHVRKDAVTILIAESALGVALLAVVLAALAVLVTFFDDYYRQILSQAPRGVPGAMVPYQVVAFVGACGASVGFLTALAWPILPDVLQALLLGLTTGFVIWAAAGTVQLVNITVFHGVQRARLLEAVDEVRSRMRKRSA
jgi:hypothetical protein